MNLQNMHSFQYYIFFKNLNIKINLCIVKGKLLPIFIFDGETPTTNLCGYNKIKFLLECLEDVEQQFQEAKGKLYFLQ